MSRNIKIAMLLSIFLWSSAFVGIRAGLQTYSPEGLALLRYIVASFCMGAAYYWLPNRNRIKPLDQCLLMALGVMGIGLYNIGLNYVELTITSGTASFIISQVPIVTAVLALLFLGERLTWIRMLGFAVSISGIALMTLSQRGGLSLHWSSGLMYMMMVVLASSFYGILQKPFLKKYHAIETTTYIIWGGTLFLCFYFPALQHDLTHASLKATLLVIYLGVFPAAIGYLAWSYVLSTMSASRAASFLYFIPFVTLLIGWLWLGEVPAMMSLIGGTIALGGVWLVNRV